MTFDQGLAMQNGRKIPPRRAGGAHRPGWLATLVAVVLGIGLAGAAQAAAPARPGRVFRDCPHCPSMVVIPAGHGWIGAEPADQARIGVPPEIAPHEQPRHEVVIERPFALAQTFVTRRQFARFAAATGRSTQPGCNVLKTASDSWGPDAKADWRNPGFPQTPDDPVVCVSWPDAKAYVAWLSKVTQQPYRLPSEAEYEYAARAGSQASRYWGETAQAACRHASLSGLERAEANRLAPLARRFFQCRDGFVYTSPARSFPPNAFGLYDMLGNVWEWTEDCYNPDHLGAPGDGSPRLGGDCGGHVDKGSSWVNSPFYLSAAARHKDLTDNRDTVLGFRVARDIAPPARKDGRRADRR